MEFKIEIAVASRGVRIDAGINGAPLVRVRDPQSQQTVIPVDWWTMPEDNQLTATISAEDGELPPSVDLSVRLTADRNQPLARLQWQLPLGASFEPFSIAIPFAALAVPTASLWDRCVAVDELDARSLAAIQAIGADLHRAFGIRDVGRIGRFLEQRMADFCVSFDDDLVSHRRAVEDEFSEILSAAAVVLAPAVPSEIRVTPCAGGRVFHLTRDDGGELIDLKGDAAAVSMQVFVARLGTEWAVVR